jgi:hypothetical protein
MKDYEPSLADRKSTSAKARLAQVEKARANAPAKNPDFAKRQEERWAIGIARDTRSAERKATKIREAEEQAAERKAADACAIAAREAADVARAIALKAEQETRETELAHLKHRQAAQEAQNKAARDARYAARKARAR